VKHRQVLRPRHPGNQFGLAGPWDGRRRPLDPAAPKLRQRPPYGGLSEAEFERLSPEEKIALANGERSDGR
jgi:hypothetical protein